MTHFALHPSPEKTGRNKLVTIPALSSCHWHFILCFREHEPGKTNVFIFKYETMWAILLLPFLKCVQNLNLEAIDV